SASSIGTAGAWKLGDHGTFGEASVGEGDVDRVGVDRDVARVDRAGRDRPDARRRLERGLVVLVTIPRPASHARLRRRLLALLGGHLLGARPTPLHAAEPAQDHRVLVLMAPVWVHEMAFYL